MITVFGGIGIFLIGMSMLTNGLKEIAGEALKKWLNKITRGTFSSLFTGLFMTIIMQSSTATTLLTVGFVSAGLISFVQSIGVIIGANIGSTSTGWIISLLGFKISLQAMALPIIGVGAFMQLIAPYNIKKFGSVLVGFGLLFLGIDLLQQGMNSAQELISFDSFKTDSIWSIFLLIIIGIVMTIIMQASSAAMAATLAALFSGAIDYEQAAYLVIGQNIGTTATAIFASIGSSIAAKRTATTHLLFNVITAIIVTIFFKYILQLTEAISIWMTGTMDETLGLAMFHTLFSIIGAILFLPFIKPFARLLEKLLPEKENALTRNLDANLVSVPAAALEVSYTTLVQLMKQLTNALLEFLQTKKVTPNFEKKVAEVEEAVEITRQFLDSVQSNSSKIRNKHIDILHTLDHVSRLIKVFREQQKFEAVTLHESIMNQVQDTMSEVEKLLDQKEKIVEIENTFEQISQKMALERKRRRNEYFERTVVNETQLDVAVSKVESILWIDRLVYHYWRATARMSMFTSTEKNKD
ncbi:Na/Pi cotransporter family protein [Lysinibacillus sp. BW-2-10]|uniref:Na/Pi cotransporter family protein n=1 Tax=Lysinibacillus sp. BW-2-10 TaxID=2590030 RepID=UPI00117C5BE4|nr:Na/Pi symporter [Lysinibacillus sp. BW-2-10]TSI06679.1 Na/Pi cotransporter family protein [Lysinibacillus sp. BW-2-10]